MSEFRVFFKFGSVRLISFICSMKKSFSLLCFFVRVVNVVKVCF